MGARLKKFMHHTMDVLNETFEASSRYREHRLEGRYILRGAKGEGRESPPGE